MKKTEHRLLFPGEGQKLLNHSNSVISCYLTMLQGTDLTENRNSYEVEY